MAQSDQIYLGIVLTNTDPSSGGLNAGDLVQLDTGNSASVIKVTSGGSSKVLGVVVTGAAQNSKVVVGGFPGQRLNVNCSTSLAANVGDKVVSASIAGTASVNNSASSDQIIGYVLTPKVTGIGNTLDVIFTTLAAAGGGAGAGAGQVLIDGTDTTADYLSTKLLAGTNITLTVVAGASEKLRIDAAAGAPNNAIYFVKTIGATGLTNAIGMDTLGGPGFLKIASDGTPSIDTNAYLVSSGFGGAPPAVASASAAGSATTASRSNHTHALDMIAYAPSLAGMQAGGVIQQTYSSPTATPAVLSVTAGLVPFGAATGGVLTQSTGLSWNDTAKQLYVLSNGAGLGSSNVVLRLENSNATPTGVGIKFYAAGTQYASIIANSLATPNSIGISLTNSGGSDSFAVSQTSGQEALLVYTNDQDVLLGSRGISTSSTVGFVWLPPVSGVPTGIPSHTGFNTRVPTVIDTTDLRFYSYISGGWHYASFDDGAGATAGHAYMLVTQATSAPVNAFNLGALTSGVLQQTVASSISTPSALNVGAGLIPFGAASGGILTTDAGISYVNNGTGASVTIAGVEDAQLKLNVTTTPGVLTSSILFQNAGTTVAAIQGFAGTTGGSTKHNYIRFQVNTLSGGDGGDKVDIIDNSIGSSLWGVATASALTDMWGGSPTTIAANGTGGFVWLPSIANRPTGVPALSSTYYVNRMPVVLDPTNQALSFWNSSTSTWHFATFFDYDPSTNVGRVPFVGATAHTLVDSANLVFDGNVLTVSKTISEPGDRVIQVNNNVTSAVNASIFFQTNGTDRGFVQFGTGGISIGVGTGGGTTFQLSSATKNIAFGYLQDGDIGLGDTAHTPATTTTTGFVWFPHVAGVPTGVPTHLTDLTNSTATIIDTTDLRNYAYIGGNWVYSVYDNGAGATAGNAYMLVTRATSAPVNAVNLGAMTSGVLQQTVASSIATVTPLNMVAMQVPYGDTNGVLKQSSSITYDDSINQLHITTTGTVGERLIKLEGINATVGIGIDFFANGSRFGAIVANAATVSNGNSISVAVPASANPSSDQFVIQQYGAGEVLVAWIVDKDLHTGLSMTAGSTTGFLHIPYITGGSPGTPTHATYSSHSRSATVFDSTNQRIWYYDYPHTTWHFQTLTDYDPTATRIPFGSATAHELTDSANLTWTNGTQVLNITQVVSQTNPILNLVSTDATGADLYIQATTPGAAGKDEFCSWFYNSGSNFIGELNFAHLAGSGGGNNAIAWSLSAGTNANKQDYFAVNGPVDTPWVSYTQLFDTFVGTPNHLATNAVNGFIWIPTVNGVPTGTPAFEGPAWPAESRQPLVIDDIDKRLYFYNGSGWHFTAFDDGSADGIANAYMLVTQATSAPAHAFNLGALASGVLQQTVTSGVSTPAVFSTTAGQVQFGAASGGGLANSTNLTWVDASGSETLTLNSATNLVQLNMTTVSASGTARSTWSAGGNSIVVWNANRSSGTVTNSAQITVSQANTATTGGDLFSVKGGSVTGNILNLYTQTFDAMIGGLTVATTDVTGFLYLPSTAGAPTGVPAQDGSTPAGNRKATIIDSTDKRFYAYLSGTWRYAMFDNGATANSHFVTTQTDAGLPNSFSLGSLASGFVKISVSGGVATITSDTNTYLTQAYQTIQAAGTGLTQRSILNFSSKFSVVDNVGSTRTDVDLATTGVTAGTYTFGTFTVNTQGQITSASSGSVASTAAHYVVTQTESGLPNSTNLGGLSSGFVKISVVSGVASITSDTNTYLAQAYTTVMQAAVAVTQRSNLNFVSSSRITAVDNGAGRTDVDLATTAVTAGTYAAPTLTIDNYGRVTGATAVAYQPLFSFAAGSILFSGGGSSVLQDNVNLYWDGTGKRLGLGTNSIATNTVVEFTLTPPNITPASGTVLNAYKWDATTVTFVGIVAGGITTATGVNFIDVERPTYTDASALNITNAATFVIKGAPIAGSAVTFTNAYSLWVQQGSVRFDGTGGDSLGQGIILGGSASQAIEKTGGTFYLATQDNNTITFITNGSTRANINTDGTAAWAVTMNPATDNTYDLGNAAAAWKHAWINTLNVDSTVQSVGSNLTLQNASTADTQFILDSSKIQVKGSVLPTTTTTYNLGSASQTWSDVYTAQVNGATSGSLTLQDTDASAPNCAVFLTNGGLTLRGRTVSILFQAGTSTSFALDNVSGCLQFVTGNNPASGTMKTITWPSTGTINDLQNMVLDSWQHVIDHNGRDLYIPMFRQTS